MLIKEVILENIGAYQGKHSFDLSPNPPKQNVILIGGENGAGKTTFLNSIRLGLFGCYGYGYKTENAEYYKRVYEYLNATARKTEENSFKIIIVFYEVENYTRRKYRFERSWKVQFGQVKENLVIWEEKDPASSEPHDEVVLDGPAKDIYESKLREYFPPKLFDLCLFDGEEISKIINENKLPDYLKELSTVVFNLDLFKSLQQDLTTYLQNELDPAQLSSLEQEVMKLLDEEQNQMNNITKIQQQVEDDFHHLQDLKDHYATIQHSFETHGGLVKAERDTLHQQIVEIETDRKNNGEKIREFVQTLLPFHLNRGLLTQVKEQMQAENQLSILDQLTNELTNERMLQVIQNLQLPPVEETAVELKKQILTLLQPDEKQVNTIHLASPSQRSQIEAVALQVEGEDAQFYIDLVKKNKAQLARVQKLRKKLSTNDDTNEFLQMLEEMKSIQEQIIDLEKSLEEKQVHITALQEELLNLQKQIATKQKTVQQSTKTQTAFKIAQNMMKVSVEFQKTQHQKKLQQVQMQATQMLNKLMRKHRYITSLRIDVNTFEVSLFDKEGEPISKETLSAGEKQLLLLSLIWSIFQCSGRRVPFIFDTLLGRLDQTHKHNVLVDLIPLCGDQVLILSTNSEIDEKYFELLQHHMAQSYSLHFNIDEQKIDVMQQYFNFQKGGQML